MKQKISLFIQTRKQKLLLIKVILKMYLNQSIPQSNQTKHTQISWKRFGLNY